MDRIKFVIEYSEYRPKDEVRIFINGRDLVDMLREFELPLAKDEGSAIIAGGYGGLSAAIVLLPSRHFLGEPHDYGVNDDTWLLGCDCGEPGCWPFEARVTLTETEVVWDKFNQPHRDWDYSGFGPFRFDRAQYEAALQAHV